MNHLTLIRGFPGSGKTTLAKKLIAENQDNTYIALVEADQYFTSSTGQYQYDRSKISDAHAWCQQATQYYLDKGDSVIVANTFTRLWELWPYFNMGYPTRVLRATGCFPNIHGVPDEVVKRMKENYELLPWEKANATCSR